jgi:hypothetical protein
MSPQDATRPAPNETSAAPDATGSAAPPLPEAETQAQDQPRARASEAVGRTLEAARAEAMARAEAAKEALLDQGARLARQLREPQGGDGLSARLMAAGAEALGEVALALRDRPLPDLLGEAERFARRNPGAFVAAAAILGFALVRFARASSARPEASDGPGAAGSGAEAGAAPGGASPRDPTPGLHQSGMTSGRAFAAEAEEENGLGGTAPGAGVGAGLGGGLDERPRGDAG